MSINSNVRITVNAHEIQKNFLRKTTKKLIKAGIDGEKFPDKIQVCLHDVGILTFVLQNNREWQTADGKYVCYSVNLAIK